MTNIQTLRESTFPVPRLLPLLSPQITLSPFGEARGGTGRQGQGVVFLPATPCCLLSSSSLPSFLLFSCALVWVLHGPQSAQEEPALAWVIQGLQSLWGTVVELARAGCDWHRAAPDILPWRSPLQHSLLSPACYQDLAKGAKYSL